MRTYMIVACVVLIGACGGDSTSPTPGPGPDPLPVPSIRIQLSDTVSYQFPDNRSTALFTIQLTSAQDLVVFADPVQGNMSVSVIDSVTGTRLASADVQQSRSGGHLMLNHTELVHAAAGQILQIRVQKYTSAGSVRLFPYPVRHAPETVGATLAVSDTVTESFDNLADIDEFTFSGAAGDQYAIFLADLAAMEPGGIEVLVRNSASTDTLALFWGGGGVRDFELMASGRFRLPSAGSWIISVTERRRSSSSDEAPGDGSYTLLLRKVNVAPEHVAATLQPGDTVETELIEFNGDLDEFQVQVDAGEHYGVFLLSKITVGRSVVVAILVPGISDTTWVASDPTDTVLADQSAFVVPTASGVMTIQVYGDDQFGPNLVRGPYRLFVYPVNTAPEDGPANVTAGTTVVESFDYPGDIDEFEVTPGPGALTNIVLRKDLPVTMSILAVVAPGNGAACTLYGGQAGPCDAGRVSTASPFAMMATHEPGQGTRVIGSQYQVELLALNPAPETRSASIALGEFVTEPLDPVQDLDIFDFSYTAGDILNVTATLQGSTNVVMGIRIGGNALFGLYDAIGNFSSGPLLLPSSGVYQFLITGVANGNILALSTGSYSFTVSKASLAVESSSGSIQAGDSLVTEQIDVAGDADAYSYVGVPGSQVVVGVRSQSNLRVDVLDASTERVVASGNSQNTGRVTVPPSGQLKFLVWEQRIVGRSLREGFDFVGPYAIVAYAVDTLPEAVPQTLTLGVQQQAEKVEHPGDIDVFEFSGTVGQTVQVEIQVPFDFGNSPLRVELVDPSNGAVLATKSTSSGIVVTDPVVLPATRTYRVRLLGEFDYRGWGGYYVTVR